MSTLTAKLSALSRAATIVALVAAAVLVIAFALLDQLADDSVVDSQRCAPVHTREPYLPGHQVLCEDGLIYDR